MSRRLAPLALLVASSALSFVGCKPKELPVTPLDEVCNVENGTTVRTAGFLTGPGGSMLCDGTTCEMALSNRGVGGNTSIRIDVRLGSGRNKMVEPPDSYQTSDLIVRDNEGVEKVVGDWVIVQGRILTGEACLITPVSWVFSGEAPPLAGSTPSEAPPGPNPTTTPSAQPPGGNKPAAEPPVEPAKP